jgi:hypothetical protein
MPITRQVTLDEESNLLLERMAEAYQGDVSRVVCELLRIHAFPESEMDALEQAHAEELVRQRDASERHFREGRLVPREELKRQCGL